jgi:hypothetical protein
LETRLRPISSDPRLDITLPESPGRFQVSAAGFLPENNAILTIE